MDIYLKLLAVISTLLAIRLMYVFYKENKELRKQRDELRTAIAKQTETLSAKKNNDLDRQLNNLFNYNGTAVGQVKRGDE